MTSGSPLGLLKANRFHMLAAWTMVSWASIACLPQAARAAESIFTIANYPIESKAKNAVAAKRKAIAEGRAAAFRSLLKRIVPVAAYRRVADLKVPNTKSLIAGVSVRSERNSGTRYIATLDYSFSARAVKQLLRRQAIPFVDRAAPATKLVTLFSPAPPGTLGITAQMSPSAGGKLWRKAWADLDLANALAPIKISRKSTALNPNLIRGIIKSDATALEQATSAFGSKRLILAIVQPRPSKNRLRVVVAGRDAVGQFALSRNYLLDSQDFLYSLELAAVITLGVLEGRWKAVNAPNAGVGVIGTATAGLQDVQLWVSFQNLAQWNSRQALLSGLPGVEDFVTGGLSARGARVSMRYPGGGQRLRAALASQGLRLDFVNGTWVLQ
ncbi:MAG: DUF2066 domain-containing protein [Hyphomicrobiaceae bacterium]